MVRTQKDPKNQPSPDFQSFIERSSVLFTVIDEDGTIVYQNPALETVTGHRTDQVIGASIYEYVHEDDRERIEQAVSAPDESAPPTDFRFLCNDGSWVWLRAIDLWGEGNQTVFTTREIPYQQELERRVERFEVILDSLDDGVYAIEPDGTIVYANEAYAEMKGVDRESLIGTNIYAWGSQEAARRIAQIRKEIESGRRESGVVEFDFTRVEGEPIPVELHFGSVTRPGNELERVGVMRDVSDRKKKEFALERKNERLEEFASIVSHDLRNPLNVAMGRLELAQAEIENEHLEPVGHALQRMNDLIEDILELSRQGNQARDLETITLARVSELSWQSVETHNARLDVRSDRSILADRYRFVQLLENLFRNAVEHAGDFVTVTVGDIDDGFFLEDNGRGIPESDREEVFEAGFSTTPEGTGFGLSIVRQIAEAHGWSVEVTTGEEGGARFEFAGVEVIDQ